MKRPHFGENCKDYEYELGLLSAIRALAAHKMWGHLHRGDRPLNANRRSSLNPDASFVSPVVGGTDASVGRGPKGFRIPRLGFMAIG
jgi:hypothetical protein